MARTLRWSLWAFPKQWRDRFGAELVALVDELDEHGWSRLRLTLDILMAAAREWVDRAAICWGAKERRPAILVVSLVFSLVVLATLGHPYERQGPTLSTSGGHQKPRGSRPGPRIVSTTNGAQYSVMQNATGPACSILSVQPMGSDPETRTASVSNSVRLVLVGRCSPG